MAHKRRKRQDRNSKNMGSQLRWLERTPDKREVDGSIPFEPTKSYLKKEDSKKHIDKYIEK